MSQQKADNNIIHKIYQNNIKTITPILNKGEVNRIYIIEATDKKMIARINDKSEIERFRKEQWCMSKVSELGIPSPRILDVGVIEDVAYMLLEYIPGLNGKEIIKNEGYIWKTLGVYAKKIHTVGTKGFGEGMIKEGEFNDKWERYLKYNIDSLNSPDKLLTMQVLTEEQSQELQRRFQALQQKQFRFGLTHNDLALANIIVEGDKINLIDWGSAESTIVPHFEIIGILEDSLKETDSFFKDFLTGYNLSMKEFEEMKEDIISLTILRAVDKLRWAIDRKPELIDKSSQRVKELASQYFQS